MVVFALIGIASTLAYALLYVLLRGNLGAQEANAVALAVTAIANTAANRRFTFGFRGSAGALRHQVQGLLVFAHFNRVHVVPPLVTSEADLRAGLAILDDALSLADAHVA